MTIIQSIILGAVQGITEFLPISSSGHLIIIPEIFNWQTQSLSYDVFVHAGSLFGVIIVLFSDIKKVLSNFYYSFKKKSTDKTWLFVLIGIIPAGVAALFLDTYVETIFRNTHVVAFNLIFWGYILWLAHIYSGKNLIKIDKLKNIGIKRSILIGFAQILALIPGTSRSGITISAGLFTKMSKQTAIKYSFLLSIPLILAATIFKAPSLNIGSLGQTEIIVLIAGLISSFITSVLAIKFLIYLAKGKGFTYLAIYRIILGIIILLLF